MASERPTDMDVIREMLTRAGVVYEVEGATVDGVHEAEQSILCYAVLGDDVNRGYSGFMAVFYFDEAGALRAVGAWE